VSETTMRLPFGWARTNAKAIFIVRPGKVSRVSLPEEIAEAADEQRWDALFAESDQYFAAMGARVRAARGARRVEELDEDRL